MPAQPETIDPQGEAAERGHRKFVQLLIIDDNPADAGVTRRHCGRINQFEFDIAHELCGQDGLAYLEANDPDCVIVDYQLGVENGVELIRKIRASGNDVPIIAYSGIGTESVVAEALHAGAQDYLVKAELSADLLQRSIANAMERVRLNRKLQEERDELNSFVWMVSHDLRAPLRHVNSFSALLADNSSLDDTAREYLSHIQNAGKRLSDMFEGMLDYARSGRGDKPLTPVDLNFVMIGVLEDIETQFGGRACVSVGDLPTVYGDSMALAQLLYNLVSNGVKYNRHDAPSIAVSAQERDAEWLVQVADNGIGVPENQGAEIFKPFQRLHPGDEYEGNGFGLAITARIVKQHHARIWLDSQVDVGSTFTVAFPKQAPVQER